MLKIDFGSGYNPKKGYKTCDMTFAPNLDYAYDIITNKIIGLCPQTVDSFYMKNVLHHCDLAIIIELMDKYLKIGGTLEIIEPAANYYNSNRFLDILWYRYIIPRYEVVIPPEVRVDYLKILLNTNKYKLLKKQTESVYDHLILKKIS